jgi:protein-disulfide isomerase
MHRKTVIIGLILCTLGGFAVGLLVRWPGPAPAAGDGPALTHPRKGPADAPVTIIEISDFECPFCSKGALKVLPEVMAAYPGKIALEFWHNPLDFHKHALPAAKATMAAQLQGRFWEYHDLLFRNRKNLGTDRLVALATQVGLDMDRFKWDMADSRVAEHISNNMAASAAMGLRGTPMFIVNGVVIQGAQPAEKFKTVIDAELEKARAALAQGISPAQLHEKLARENGANDKFVRLFIHKQSPGGLPQAKKKTDRQGPVETVGNEVVWNVPVDPSDPQFGPDSPRVTIVVFSDFQCPFSGKGTALLRSVLEDFPEGIRIVYKNFPLPFHKDAHLAAEAALCAQAQGRFWEYHDILFENQRAMAKGDLENYARRAGLDMDRFRQDLAGGTFREVVERHMEEGTSLGVKGTPNFFINGRVIKGAVPYDQLRPLVEEEMKI